MADAVYEMDWYSLDLSSMKLLLTVMTRSLKPMELTIGYIIPVNIETFIKVRNFYVFQGTLLFLL